MFAVNAGLDDDPLVTTTDMDQMVRRIIGEHIEVTTEIDGDLGPVKIDPNQVHQVILNLVVNARDAMPDGGTLTLELMNAELGDSSARAHNLAPGRYVMLAGELITVQQ